LIDLDAKSEERRKQRELVVLYSFQMLGERTVQETTDFITDNESKLGVKISRDGVSEAVTDLCRKTILVGIRSGSTGEQKDGEISVIKYAMAKPAFVHTVEVAHLSVLIPNLIKELAEDTKTLLETEINSGEKKNRGYYNTHFLEMYVQVVIPIRGTLQSNINPQTGDKATKGESFGVLYRNGSPKNILIPHSWIKGYFAANMKFMSSADGFAHLAAEDVILDNPKIVIMHDPLPEGRGIATNEAIAEGTQFKITVAYPTEGGYLNVEKTKRLMALLAKIPRAGLGKNNGRWGRILVTSYKMTEEASGKTVAEMSFR